MLTYRGLLSDGPEITRISLCSTVPAVLHELRLMLSRYYADVRSVIVEPGTKTGVQILTDNPKEVGPTVSSTPLRPTTCTADPPSLSTSHLDESRCGFGNGRFLGGRWRREFRSPWTPCPARAAQLRKVELVRPRSVIGKNTVEALQSGALYGFAGQVDGWWTGSAEIPGVQAVIATGGLAEVVVPESRTITAHCPELTLIGLALVFAKNQVP